jgi:hypothetical protein
MSKQKPILSASEAAAIMGRKGGQAGKGQAKARTSEQARKANAASQEAKRRKRAKPGGD